MSKITIDIERVYTETMMDIETREHSERVATLFYNYLLFVNEFYNKDYTFQEMEQAVIGAMYHDLGKSYIENVHLKEGKLTEDDYKLIKTHPMVGFEIFKKTYHGEISEITSDIILYHHERVDGNGYYNIEKEMLKEYVRDFIVIDAFDAMVSYRSYNIKKDMQQALDELRRCSGTQFDIHSVNQFIEFVKKRT